MIYTQNFDHIQNALASIPEGNVVETNHLLVDGKPITKSHSHHMPKGRGLRESFYIAPGVTFTHVVFMGDYMAGCCHQSLEETMEINYCRYGRVGWDMKDGQSIYLGSDDFSINTQALCADSLMALPSGFYEGITVTINTQEFDESLPAVFIASNLTGKRLLQKCCPGTHFLSLTGNEITRPIFQGFFEDLKPKAPHIYVHVLDLLIFLFNLPTPEKGTEAAENMNVGQYRSEQIDTIKQIHDYLLENLDEKITIEQVGEKFHMNTTTIKQVFKGVYGDSIASHIREHRMEHAAKLLTETEMSIAEIAGTVGYGSQSKFAENFKEAHGVLPLEYKKSRKR